eukprot:gene4989-biopygen4955
MASRAQRREQLVDPVIPEASWEWLRGLPLEEVFACPFSTARHVPKRAKNAYAEAMRWVLHSLSGDNEDFWRLQGVPSRLLPAPRPEAQRKSIHLDEWSSSGKESEGCWQLAKAIGRLDPGVLDPLQPETLEALAELHPAGDGLPAQVGPGCSQLRFEHLGAIFGAGDGVHAIKHACEQLVSNRVPSGILSWLMGARLVALLKPGGGVRPNACGETLRRLTGKWFAGRCGCGLRRILGRPRRESEATSSAAQVGVGVPEGAELDCKNAFNTVHRRAIFQAVYVELLGLTESCLRHEARLGWRGADGTFHRISSAEGAQQGDPLGPFFMAAPLQPVLQAALRAHPDMYIIAYLDDIHILGEPGRVWAAYDTIVLLLEGIGLHLNGAVEPLEGIQVLGVPIGSDAWVADKCVEIATKAGSILPKLARLNDPQVQLLLLRATVGIGGVAGLVGPCVEKMVVMFPAVRDLLLHLGAPEGTDFGGYSLVAGLVAAMEDVRGGRERALAAEREEHPVPEGLQIPAEAPGWEGFGDNRPASQKELTIYQHGSDWLCLFNAANPSLGITVPLVREVSSVGTGRCACGEVVDQFGYHYLACSRRGMFTYRHDAVQDVLVEMLRKPDITVLNYDGRGWHLIIVVVVGFPCASSYVEAASREPQHTARLEERRKEYLYGDVSPHKLVPFAVEAFGGLGVHAKKFLEMCAERRQERLGPELISATWSNPTFKSYWGQKLMVALQGSQAFGLHTRALEDFPQ